MNPSPHLDSIIPEQEGCEHHPTKCCECMLKEIDEEYLSCMSDEDKHYIAALISIDEVP
ncbi:hypothetical protein [Acinetobacter sp. NigerLNRRAM0016]